MCRTGRQCRRRSRSCTRRRWRWAAGTPWPAAAPHGLVRRRGPELTQLHAGLLAGCAAAPCQGGGPGDAPPGRDLSRWCGAGVPPHPSRPPTRERRRPARHGPARARQRRDGRAAALAAGAGGRDHFAGRLRGERLGGAARQRQRQPLHSSRGCCRQRWGPAHGKSPCPTCLASCRRGASRPTRGARSGRGLRPRPPPDRARLGAARGVQRGGRGQLAARGRCAPRHGTWRRRWRRRQRRRRAKQWGGGAAWVTTRRTLLAARVLLAAAGRRAGTALRACRWRRWRRSGSGSVSAGAEGAMWVERAPRRIRAVTLGPRCGAWPSPP
jgi:hypothetical protein